jgi:drug/metabolite transporter (DMT)-like permease
MELKNFLWIILFALLVGSSFLFIKIAVQEIPPFTLVLLRSIIAAVILYVVLRMQGYRLFKFIGLWKQLVIVSLNTSLTLILISWGEQYIDSAIAAILQGTIPLFTIVLAHFFTKDDRLTFIKIIGTLIGFIGLMLLVAPSFINHLQTSIQGLVAIIFSSAIYAGNLIYVRKYIHDIPNIPTLVMPTTMLFLSALYMLPFSLLIEHSFNLPVPSFKAIGALLVLSIIGTALAFWLYFYILERVNATNMSMTSFLIPLVGTILGIVVLDEQLTWNIYVGGVFIIISVMMINEIFKSVLRFR